MPMQGASYLFARLGVDHFMGFVRPLLTPETGKNAWLPMDPLRGFYGEL